MNIDENVQKVIKLLLQPLVENALLHGFDESGQTGKLMLRVKKKENNIEFSVLNNGNKMDLEKVKQALQLPEDAKPTPTMAKDAHTQASLISSVPEVIK